MIRIILNIAMVIIGITNLILGIYGVKNKEKVIGICGIIIGVLGLLTGAMNLISIIGGI